MERAARAVADAVLARFPEARRIRAVCGKGANGGDGRIAVRLLRETGLDAEESTDLDGADVVVDALFGTGFSGAPRAEAAELIRAVNAAGAPVVAVDIPSGVDASTGEVPGEAVEAELTVTMHGLKVGLVVGPAASAPVRSSRPTSGSSTVRPETRSSARSCSTACRASGTATTSTPPAQCSWSAEAEG